MSVHKVPTKIVLIGNQVLAIRTIGYARQLMGIVENLMSFQNLSQYSLTRKTGDGCVVECWSSFGLRQITITAPSKGGKPKPYKQKCFCTSCVSLGFITKVNSMTFIEGTPCYDYVDPIPLKANFYCFDVTYSALVCAGQTYTIFENIKALDNMPYCVGDKVLVIPIISSDDSELFIGPHCYDACGRACFASASSPVIATGIIPIDVESIPKFFMVPDGD